MMNVLNDNLLMWTFLESTFSFYFSSEKFMVRLNKNGGPKNPEKVDRLCALFTVGTHLINSIDIAMAK